MAGRQATRDRPQVRTLSIVIALGVLLTPFTATAHELDPGFLELRETAPGDYSVLWKVPLKGGRRMPLDPIFPAECTATTPVSSRPSGRGLIERWSIHCPSGLTGAEITIGGLERTYTDVLIRVEMANDESHLYIARSIEPTIVVGAAGESSQPVFGYLRLGFEHILFGFDHLLFVLGLLLIVQNRWMLVKTVTSFTVAHSITLAIATLGLVTLPVRPLEAAIALSILFLGPEIVRVWRGESSFTIRHAWVVAFAFGLLHGFGFASGLGAIGLPQSEIPLALLLFNLGVEAGQLSFVLLIFAAERVLTTLEISWPLWVQKFPGYAVGSLGAFWTIQRTLMIFTG